MYSKGKEEKPKLPTAIDEQTIHQRLSGSTKVEHIFNSFISNGCNT